MKPICTLPLVSVPTFDRDSRYPIRVFEGDSCEYGSGDDLCLVTGYCIGSDEFGGKLCVKHFREQHIGEKPQCVIEAMTDEEIPQNF